MENIGIIIIETDRNYASALSNTLSRLYPGFRISIRIFDDIQSRDAENYSGNTESNYKITDNIFKNAENDYNYAENDCKNGDNNCNASESDYKCVENDDKNSGTDYKNAATICRNIDEALKDFDICLMSSSFIELTNLIKQSQEKIIILYDAYEEESPHGFMGIDKYSNCEAIIHSILCKYADSAKIIPPISNVFEGSSEILSFFSTEGGVGTTSVSLGFAKELAMYRGKKVMFLSREPFEAVSFCNSPIESGGSSDYLYYFLKKEEKKLSRLRDAVIIRDDFGVMRFIPSRKRNRLCELSEVDFMSFVSHLSTATGADTFVIDRGVWVGDYLSGQRLIYVLKAESNKSKAANEVDINIFGLSDEQKNELVLVENNPYRSRKDVNTFEETNGIKRNTYTGNPIVKIEWDGADFIKKGNGVEISLTNVFGNSIKELADIVLRQTMRVENLVRHVETNSNFRIEEVHE